MRGRVTASTQNQALAALLFLYRNILEIELLTLDAVRAKRPERLPVVLSVDEVRSILDRMDGVYRLMAELMYGGGLRPLECCHLRIKDVDFDLGQIVVREGKEDNDRAVPLPRSRVEQLPAQVARVKGIHDRDLDDGFGRVWLPYALREKYPRADRELGWQYLFPSSRRGVDPRHEGPPEEAPRMWHHVHENMVQKQFRNAVLTAGLTKRASCHTLRHCHATHLLEEGHDIRTV